MGRKLRWLGSVLLLVTVALWVGDAVSWIPQRTDDRWSGLTLKAAGIALAGWLLLRLLAPLRKQLRKGRCAVCGCATEQGRTYCLDHLQETVNTTRDRSHAWMNDPAELSRRPKTPSRLRTPSRPKTPPPPKPFV